jgi:hypothetical protein
MFRLFTWRGLDIPTPNAYARTGAHALCAWRAPFCVRPDSCVHYVRAHSAVHHAPAFYPREASGYTRKHTFFYIFLRYAV